jgi:hypothetical protein
VGQNLEKGRILAIVRWPLRICPVRDVICSVDGGASEVRRVGGCA